MDRIFESFLNRQAIEGAELAAAGDLLQLLPVKRGDGPIQHYAARFLCRGFVKNPSGAVVPHEEFTVGIFFDDEYLRQASTYQVLTLLSPASIFLPNARFPHICIGEKFFRPGTPLVEILYQLHSVLTYRRWASNAGLNAEACEWAINHQELFPSDPRPLKRRKLELQLEMATRLGGRP